MLRIVDARVLPPKTRIDNCDVCVVGAGAAGLVVAVGLVRRGISTVVLDAGDRICADGRSVGIEAMLEGTGYRAATEGRAFGLGGSTALWGGQLVPHSELDFRGTGAEGFDFWRYVVAAVRRYRGEVMSLLGLGLIRDSANLTGMLSPRVVEALRSREIEVVASEWLPFRKRNLAFLAERAKVSQAHMQVYLNAPAVTWEVTDSSSLRGLSRVVSVTARAANRTIMIKARSFVLAAGAIESTRILLEIQRQHDGRLFGNSCSLGLDLGDHLSCRVADVATESRRRCVALFGPRFRNGLMRSFRLVQRSESPEVPRHFFHFIYENQNLGFLLAKRALAAAQAGRLPRVSARELVLGVGGVTALAWNRFVRSRLYIPAETASHLQLDIEQAPNPSNRIELADELDATGRPKAIVRWSPSTEDYDAIRAAASRFLSLWPDQSAGFPRLLPALGDAAEPKPHDVYHPVGTCRMGVDEQAVVDPSLRVQGLRNLAAVTTAVFPTAGTANPTLSMLCLAAGLAERLAKELGR